MTSEVVLLNRRGAIIAADSAVTVGRDPHPRYSKSATKIFEACEHGNIAISIYGSADVDQMPWELAIKQFRAADAGIPQRAKVKDYVQALIDFLHSSPLLFSEAVLESQLDLKVAIAALKIVEDITRAVPSVADASVDIADRQQRWNEHFANAKSFADTMPRVQCLTQQNYDICKDKLPRLRSVVKENALTSPMDEVVDLDALAQLALDYIFKMPWYVLSSTGIVFTGYGREEMFPSFTSIKSFGHIGEEFCHTADTEYAITHQEPAWIQSFAQASMINRFTDGFDTAQVTLLESAMRTSIPNLMVELVKKGATIDRAIALVEINTAIEKTVAAWRQKNWAENFHPLRVVLASLSMGEMADLAETLLVLESLRERMTSPSESVGGPIDVAVVTKSEGLVWIKRKKYFNSAENPRYLKRNGL